MNIIKVCSTAFVFAAVSLLSVQSQPDNPVRIAFAVPGTVVVDGILDTAWSVAPMYGFGNFLPYDRSSRGSSSNHSGSWRALYDEDNLYVLLYVYDDVFIWNQANSEQGDLVELFLSGTYTRSFTSAWNISIYDFNDYHIKFGLGTLLGGPDHIEAGIHSTPFWYPDPGVNETNGVKYAVQKAANGYLMEIQISLHLLFEDAQIDFRDAPLAPDFNVNESNFHPYRKIGFELHTTDSDVAGVRAQKLAWANHQGQLSGGSAGNGSDNAWLHPGSWGTLVFAEGDDIDTSFGAPSMLRVVETSMDTITLKWNDNAPDAASFSIERRLTSGGEFQAIAVRRENFTEAKDTGLSPGTSYTYRVRALRPAGVTPYSNEVVAVTKTQDEDEEDSPAGNAVRIGFSVPGSITVDGNIDQAWEAASLNYLDNFLPFDRALPGSSSNHSGSWRSLYDEDNLYLLVSISDDVIVSGATSGDVIDLFLSGTYTRTFSRAWNLSAYDFNDYQMQFGLGELVGGHPNIGAGLHSTPFWAPQSGVNESEGVKYVVVETEEGYLMEIQVALELLYMDADFDFRDAPLAPDYDVDESNVHHYRRVGFEIQATDSDEEYGRAQKLAWANFEDIYPGDPASNGSDTAWAHPGTWGTLVFVDALSGTPASPGPNGLAAKAVQPNQIIVSWKDNSSNEEGFELQRRIEEEGFVTIATLPANTKSYLDSGLPNGVVYTYRVRATNAAGPSPYSSEASAFIPSRPSAPTNLVAELAFASESGGPKITVLWSETTSADETGFEIEFRTEDGSYEWIIDYPRPAPQEPLNFFPVEPNTTYTYRVRAKNEAGYSGYTDMVTVTTPAPYVAPVNVMITSVTGTSVSLSWTDVPDHATGIVINRWSNRGPVFDPVTLLPGTTSFVDTDVRPEWNYEYTVDALYEFGWASVAPVQATTLGVPPLAPSSLEANTVSEGSVSISWADNASDATGFVIQRRTGSGNFVTVATASASTTSYLDMGLLPGTTYGYRVLATNALGNSEPSNEIVVETLRIDPPADYYDDAVLHWLYYYGDGWAQWFADFNDPDWGYVYIGAREFDEAGWIYHLNYGWIYFPADSIQSMVLVYSIDFGWLAASETYGAAQLYAFDDEVFYTWAGLEDSSE